MGDLMGCIQEPKWSVEWKSAMFIPTNMATAGNREEWLDRLPAGQFRMLFEHLSGMLFFAKNLELKLMMGNPAFLARCGKTSEQEIVGKDDYALFPPRLAEHFRNNDLEVIRTGKPLMDILELFPDEHGNPDWSMTDKIPLFDKDGKVCGLCGIVRSYEGVRESLQPYLDLQPAVEYLKKNFREKLDISLLGKVVGLSERQLERKFRETCRHSPRSYLNRMRVLIAGELLKKTNKTVTEIAIEVGFYDHSDLSRHFKKEMGVPPSVFRSK